MTCSESTGNAVSFSNQERVTALLDSTGTEGLTKQRAAHRPGVSRTPVRRHARPGTAMFLLKGGTEEFQSDVVRVTARESRAIASIDDPTVVDTEL